MNNNESKNSVERIDIKVVEAFLRSEFETRGLILVYDFDIRDNEGMRLPDILPGRKKLMPSSGRI